MRWLHRLHAWLWRRFVGRCQMGEHGCPRRPVGTWRPGAHGSFLVARLCAECKAELEEMLEEMPLDDWTPGR